MLEEPLFIFNSGQACCLDVTEHQVLEVVTQAHCGWVDSSDRDRGPSKLLECSQEKQNNPTSLFLHVVSSSNKFSQGKWMMGELEGHLHVLSREAHKLWKEAV